MTTTTTSTSSKVIASTSERAKAILAKAAAKEQATLLTTKEIHDQLKAEEFDVIKNAEGVKQHDKKPASKPTKAVTKPKPAAKAKEAKSPLFCCSEAIGIVMKQNPKATADQIINKADTLYIKKTGKESNLFQMSKYYSFAVKFLKGYQSK